MRKACFITLASGLALAAGAVQMASQPWVTNRIAEAEARVGAEIASATNAIPAPDYTANNATLRATIEEVAPAPGDYASVSNAAMNAVQQGSQNWLDAESKMGAITASGDELFPWSFMGKAYFADELVWQGDGYNYHLVYDESAMRWITWYALPGYEDLIDEDTGRFSTQEDIAYLSDIPSQQDLSGYATKHQLGVVSNDLAELRTESSLVYRLYSGSNVVAEVTNYNSTVHAPTLRLMQLNESNEYVTVWTETNGLTRTLNAARRYTDDATNALPATFAPRAWSRTTSGLGADAPQDTTWISTPRTVIAGGFEYAKIVDTYGEVWVLSSNGMGMDFNPDTNAYFRITADDGTAVFSIEKADAQVVGAYAEGITVSANSVTMPVPVVSAEAPTMYWSAALESGTWADQSSPPTGATVNWSGSAGTWVCTVTFSGTRPSKMFFRFSFLQEGGVKIRNNAALEVSSGILCTDGIHKVRPVYNNGTITWEVVP